MHVFPLYLLALSLSSAYADVSVRYPLGDQLPLISRTDTQYSWTFSNESFVSSENASLTYTASNCPSWLTFDPSTCNFHGLPSKSDVGTYTIDVVATDSTDSATSSFVLVSASGPGLRVQHSVEEQFHLPSESLSSVFEVSKQSSLRPSGSSVPFVAPGSVPALRIPPKWSFSVGFKYDTFVLDDNPDIDLYYDVLQTDGSPLPPWVRFNYEDLTLDGVTPTMTRPFLYLPLALHASDRRGYSDASLPFDIYVASHELALSGSSLPTINVTADMPFSVSLSSPADFSGVLLDGEPIRPDEIVTLEVDTSFYGEWLQYDTASRTLSGQPPTDMDHKGNDEETLLPVTIMTTVNQTIETNVSLAVVPSYFSADTLQPVLVPAGQTLRFSLTAFFSNASGVTGHDDVSLSASFDPDNSTSFLSFDPTAAILSGTVPANFSASNYSHVTVTFTAYSYITHSTSHTSLPLSLTQADFTHSHHSAHSPTAPSLSPAARKRLLLGLEIAFGVIGGLVLVGAGLATVRKCSTVRDTAIVGEDGEKAWTAEEKKWYGIGIEVEGKTYDGPGTPTSSRSRSQSPSTLDDGPGGVPLTRVPTRHGQARSPASQAVLSPGVMRKADFMSKVKYTARKVSGTTVRLVSDTYRRARNVGSGNASRKAIPKFVIGKPTLLVNEDGRKADAARLSYHGGVRQSGMKAVDEDTSYAASGLSVLDDISGLTGTSFVGSPSSSTADRSAPSIPRRRQDFAPPLHASAGMKAAPLTTPPQAHVSKTHAYAVPLTRHRSAGSDGSGSGSDGDGEVAVVQRAERARSIRSLNGKDGSVWSFQTGSQGNHENANGKGSTRPRLVPFTSGARVPVPKLPSAYNVVGRNSPQSEDRPVVAGSARTKRVVSQMARVFRSESTERRVSRAEGRDTSGDDLSVGIEYVRALGDDMNVMSPGGSPSPSFSVAESSHLGQGTTTDLTSIPIPRMLARANEHFRFRIPVSLPVSSTTSLEVKLINGLRLPGFIKVDTNASSSPRSASDGGKEKERRVIELSGLPGNGDLGELVVGVYEKGGAEYQCVGKVVLEVVERS